MCIRISTISAMDCDWGTLYHGPKCANVFIQWGVWQQRSVQSWSLCPACCAASWLNLVTDIQAASKKCLDPYSVFLKDESKWQPLEQRKGADSILVLNILKAIRDLEAKAVALPRTPKPGTFFLFSGCSATMSSTVPISRTTSGPIPALQVTLIKSNKN